MIIRVSSIPSEGRSLSVKTPGGRACLSAEHQRQPAAKGAGPRMTSETAAAMANPHSPEPRGRCPRNSYNQSTSPFRNRVFNGGHYEQRHNNGEHGEAEGLAHFCSDGEKDYQRGKRREQHSTPITWTRALNLRTDERPPRRSLPGGGLHQRACRDALRSPLLGSARDRRSSRDLTPRSPAGTCPPT